MIVSCRHPLRQAWDLIPMVLSIYNAFMIPFVMSFSLPLNLMETITDIELFLDFLFLFDNLLMFFTSFINKHGVEIKDSY